MNIYKIIDCAHRALRGVDAADQTSPIPGDVLDLVSDAVVMIEEGRRVLGYPLSEMDQ